jgi:hypothetical protein
LGQKVIAEKLRDAGATVEIHDHHFPQNALDEDWISEVGKQGWVVLTKDDRGESVIAQRRWQPIEGTR